MKTRTIALLILALFALAIVAAGCSPAAENKADTGKKPASAVCPVMGNKIPDVSKAPGGKSVYKGKTYYFCCPACKPLFDKDPEKYVGK